MLYNKKIFLEANEALDFPSQSPNGDKAIRQEWPARDTERIRGYSIQQER